MSEGITIALITAIGSLLGGIVGQIITASATIEAAKIKGQSNKSSSSEKNNSWKRVVLGAGIGAIATLVILFSLGMIPPNSQNTPVTTPDALPISTKTSSSIPETASPTSSLATGDSSILFHEDFEDGKIQQITYSEEEWQIVSDETGNNVYDVDNSKGSDFPRIHLGSNSWKDYKINFRVKIISGDWVIIYFREDETASGSSYLLDINLDAVTLNYTTHGSDWKPITSRQYNFKRNEWYTISIQAEGDEIKVTVNDTVVIFTDDTKHTYGRVDIQAGQYTHAQFDDIEVLSLEK